VNTINSNLEIEELRAQVATLEQLLEVYEQETVEKSNRLEQALAELQAYSAQLVRSEAALQVLQSILDSMGECVVVADQNGKFLLLNPPAEELLSLDVNLTLTEWMESQACPVYLADKVTPYPVSDFPLVRAIRGEATDGTEVFVRSKNATEGTWLNMTARSLTDRQGNLQGGVVVCHNITKRKQTEAALRESEGRSRDDLLY
jgi:PAS domain-containing protein